MSAARPGRPVSVYTRKRVLERLRRARLRIARQCVGCAAPVEAGCLCDTCAGLSRASQAKTAHRRRQLRVCRECGKRRTEFGFTRCSNCREKRALVPSRQPAARRLEGERRKRQGRKTGDE